MEDKKTIKIVAELETQQCQHRNNKCHGCVLKVGLFHCANRELCPNTESNNVNFTFKSKVKIVNELLTDLDKSE